MITPERTPITVIELPIMLFAIEGLIFANILLRAM